MVSFFSVVVVSSERQKCKIDKMRSRSDKTTIQTPDLTFSSSPRDLRHRSTRSNRCVGIAQGSCLLAGELMGAYLRHTEAGRKRRSLSQIQ